MPSRLLPRQLSSWLLPASERALPGACLHVAVENLLEHRRSPQHQHLLTLNAGLRLPLGLLLDFYHCQCPFADTDRVVCYTSRRCTVV
jgi:hypothetical protein